MWALDAFIEQLPKVELHVHLVGSASIPTILELAQRHPDTPVPRTKAELRAYYRFRDFPHFSDVYGAVSNLVRDPADVAAMVTGIARDLAAQRVRYVELTVTGGLPSRSGSAGPNSRGWRPTGSRRPSSAPARRGGCTRRYSRSPLR